MCSNNIFLLDASVVFSVSRGAHPVHGKVLALVVVGLLYPVHSKRLLILMSLT